MLNKNFIKFNIFEYAAPIFIVKKLKNDLRVCVDYRAFNALTIKNRNIFFLIRKIFARLSAIKIYNKFDIIIVFNKMRMRKKNEQKIVFLIRYDFFEYVIMFFEFCNVLNIF